DGRADRGGADGVGAGTRRGGTMAAAARAGRAMGRFAGPSGRGEPALAAGSVAVRAGRGDRSRLGTITRTSPGAAALADDRRSAAAVGGIGTGQPGTAAGARAAGRATARAGLRPGPGAAEGGRPPAGHRRRSAARAGGGAAVGGTVRRAGPRGTVRAA